MNMIPKLSFVAAVSWLCFVSACGATVRTQSFDSDPGWEGRNNQLTLKKAKSVTQDFGYSKTHHAGKKAGEIGGIVTRAMEPGHYAAKISPRTLNDSLTASGTFALTESHASGGIFFGWFNARQPGGGRPVASLGLDIDTEKGGGRLAVRMISGENKSCGTFITPFTPGGWRPTPIRNDGTRYTWTLNYDPAGNGGKGRFQFSIKSDTTQHEDWEGKTFTVDLPDGFKKQETVLDRFGLMHQGKPGGSATIYFDDLTFDGRTEDFSSEPDWEALGNRRTYVPLDSRGANHYGYSGGTSFAGGKAGEIGGVVWRTEKNFGWYADPVGPLTLDDKLEASGKVMLAIGAPDSAVALGWFSSKAEQDVPANKSNFVGVLITGPTRVGHYFLPQCATALGNLNKVKRGPVLVPGKPHDWKLVYDPAGNDGNGEMRVTLDDETVSLDIAARHRREGAAMDRFGMVSMSPGGSMVKIYFDDLSYTAGK